MKMFRYVFTPHVRTVSEDEIRKHAALTLSTKEKENAWKILALQIGETRVLDSGAEFTRVEDDAEPFSAIVLPTMRYLRVTKWEEFQRYKNRRAPWGLT